MAVNWEKFSKPVERRKPIIFLINESATDSGSSFPGTGCCCERNTISEAINKLLADFKKHNVRADVAVITFGNTVNLLLPYTELSKLDIGGLTSKIKKCPVTNEAVFGTGLLAVKEYMEDLDETSEKIYRPTVILMTSNEPSRGWESCLNTFLKDGRSAKSQRLAVYTPRHGRANCTFSTSGRKKDADKGKPWDVATKNIVERNGSLPCEAVLEFAEFGAVVYEDSYPSGDWINKMTKMLSFDELDEDPPMVEVKKPEDDIPVLEDADFDGNSLDADSYI